MRTVLLGRKRGFLFGCLASLSHSSSLAEQFQSQQQHFSLANSKLGQDTKMGYDALLQEITDMPARGIIDPAKVPNTGNTKIITQKRPVCSQFCLFAYFGGFVRNCG